MFIGLRRAAGRRASFFAAPAMLALLLAGCPFGSSGNNNDDAINDDGSTDGGGATGAASTGGGVSGDDAIPARPTGFDLQAIATVGDSVPGQTSAVFTAFGTPIIDEDGRVAFWARYSGGAGSDGLYVWDGTELVRVIDDNPANTGLVPGYGAAAYFTGLSANNPFTSAADEELPLTWGADSRLIFVAWAQDEDPFLGVFRWRASDGDLLLISDPLMQADLYDDAVPEAFNANFYQPHVSDNGIVSFVSQYTYITTSSSFVLSKRGAYAANGVSVSRFVDTNPEGDFDVPDQSSSAVFTAVGELMSGNAAGSVVFQAAYSTSSGTGRGVYVRTNNELFRVIDSRSDGGFSGLPSGAVVNPTAAAYDAIAIGPNLRIAVDTRMTVTEGTRNTVLYFDGDRWNELQGDDEYATSLVTGINIRGQTTYLVGGQPFISGGGRSVQLSADVPSALSSVSWLGNSGSLNNNGRALLRYAGSGSRQPGLAFWNGAALLAVDGFDSITTPGSPELDRPGRSGALNDSDQFTFLGVDAGDDDELGTNDDEESIYLAEPQ